MKLNFSSLLAVLFSLVFLTNSCYTVKEQKVISYKRNNENGSRLPGEYYTFTELEKPNYESPYSTLELYKAGRYEFETTEQIEQSREANTGTFIVGGIGTAGAVGWLFSNNTNWFSTNPSSLDAFWAGAFLGGMTWWLIVKSLPEKTKRYIYQPGIKHELKNEELLTNAEIQLSVNELNKIFISNANGLLKFSPPFDFKLESTLKNDSITFSLNKGNTNFINTLKLNPLDWMKHYAEIIIPKTPVKHQNGNDIIGTAREGILYKVIGRQNDRINIMIGAKSGWIDEKDANLIYTTRAKHDFSTAIRNYVINEMEKWLKQGEFELPEDYIQRISKKDEQLLILTNRAMDTFQEEYVSYFNWEHSDLSRYDPNSQTYKVVIPELGEFIIKVPIANALKFKENWNTINFTNQKFTLVDGDWKLVSFEIEDRTQPYVARYESDIVNNYDPTNQFAFDLSDFKIEIPDVLIKQGAVVQNTDNELDDYSIKTDLPQTKMSQPDAIAVVIGNAYYQKTAPVNFAINDAQLMKLYLTNVLGFKEGNIIFVMNATKAGFEGLFGSENNHKGKLFNYLKPDISDVFIFYSGHGAPEPNSKEAFFIPTDCDPDYVELQGYALKTLYANLAKLPAKSTTVILDACFSGAGVLKNISSVRIKPKDTEDNIKNSAILSSSSGTQVSSWYNKKKQGIFTYFFLKAIHDHKNSDANKDNELTFKEIYDYISDKTNGIPYFARRLNAVEQTPLLKGSNVDRVVVKFE